jgi:hypothetical protein
MSRLFRDLGEFIDTLKYPHHHHHHLQGLSSLVCSVLKHEDSLRIRNNFFFLLSSLVACLQNLRSSKTKVLIEGFLPSDRLPTAATVPVRSCLPVTEPLRGVTHRASGTRSSRRAGSAIHIVEMSRMRVPACCLYTSRCRG